MLLSLLSLLVLAVLQGTNAVTYSVTNNAGTTPGGQKFINQIGLDYTRQTLLSSADLILRTFQQNTEADEKNFQQVSLFIDYSSQSLSSSTEFILQIDKDNEADRKNVQHVNLFIDDMDGVAYTSNDEIHVSARYIQDYNGDVKGEYTGVLYHEMTHVWQWSNGAPGGLIEGIADFVRLKAGYAPSHWVQPGEGDKWDQGYDVTARFLDYCNSLSNGFVAELNKKMKDTFSDNFFVELLGKTVDQLWSEYKAKYQT